mgnify:CR=1 FL=1|jgi:hypothetical protein
MTTIALKKYLISKINLLEDDAVLKQLKKIVQNNEKVYQLSDYQIKRLEESRKQFAEGNFYTQDEVDVMVEKWLKEK